MSKKIILNFDNIPKKTNGHCNWPESVGKTIPFNYDGKMGEIIVIGYNDDKYNRLKIQYNNNVRDISTQQLKKAKLTNFLVDTTWEKRKKLKYKYNVGNVYEYNGNKYKITGVSVRSHLNKSTNKWRHEIRYNVFCPRCKGIFNISDDRIDKNNCPICAGRQIQNGINDIPTTAPWMIGFFKGGIEEAKKYTKFSSTKIIPICPDCGDVCDHLIKISSLYNNHGFQCSCKDGMSYPEKFVGNILEQLNISYIYQASKELPFDSYGKKYDFYIPDKSLIIETHGIQHYEEVTDFRMSLEEQKENDAFKRSISKGKINNYVVIDCRNSNAKWIKNKIMDSILPQLLCFSQEDIDWIACDIAATKSLVKKICQYYNDNDATLKELSNIFKKHVSTISDYLRKGNSFGWCKYSDLYQVSKPITVYKNNVIYSYYKSIADFCRNSIDVIGYQLHPVQIRQLINSKQERDGFKFELITDFKLKREVLCRDDCF